jgi:hypothetical protein
MRYVYADLHTHLRTGSNMDGLFNKTIDIARARLGIGGVVGLVNFSDKRYEKFSGQQGYERQDLKNALYVLGKDILVVKGQEIPTADGHLLVLGLEKDKHIKEGRTLEDTIKEAKDNNAIIVADHPFYWQGISPKLVLAPRILDFLDAIEIHNGEAALSLWGIFPKKANVQVQEYFVKVRSIRPNLAALISSDGHSLRELGTSWMEIPMPCDYLTSLTSPGKITDYLRTGLIENRLKKLQTQKHDSKFGAFAHAIALGMIIALRIKNKESGLVRPEDSQSG